MKFHVNLAVAIFLSLGISCHATAQMDFNILSKSDDVEKEYRQELDKWMLRAYEGDRDAQFKVGVLFANDQFNQPDYEQAVYWYRQAARQGHVLAQYNIGHQYLTGVGVPKDEGIAMQWWLQAANQDHAQAQFNIGRAYYLGIGLEEDHEKSRYWFSRAASNQEPKSIEILQQLGWSNSAVDSAQIAESVPDEMPGDTPSAVPFQPGDEASGAASTELRDDEKVITLNGADSQAIDTPTEGAVESPALTSVLTPTSIESTSVGVPENGANESPESVDLVAVEPEPIKEPPTALYTNPKVRSVLITLVEDRASLNVVQRGKTWSAVTSSEGFPVWVHGDYVSQTDEIGTITGSAVNARSVPIITNGTVVGRLEKNEIVEIIDKRKEWYRVIAPPRFKAWVKTEDYERTPSDGTATTAVAAAPTRQETPSGRENGVEKLSGPRPINDNEWLYSQPADSYTLQLASFDDPMKINEFVSRSKFIDNAQLHRFTSSSNDIEWTYFLYGAYADKPTAESVKVEINQRKAWIRTFGLLQQNRCISWKKQLPTPPELNKYCGS